MRTSSAVKTIHAKCESRLQDGARTNHVHAKLGAQDTTLWWRFSGGQALQEPADCNHALTSLLPFAMHHQANLHIQGAVDPTLLENLDESIDAWTLWSPDL
jgi:hypothetical protein